MKLLGSRRLNGDEIAHLRLRASQPVFVSEYPRVKERLHLPALLKDQLAVAAHVEILGSLLNLDAPRVLEVRPRFGAIGGALRRIYGGETLALSLFEVQQVLIREVYGSRADFLLDYDSFAIPYDGCFDLVIANHLVTHAVHPAAALRTIRERLGPGGHLYLYNEPDEHDFLETGKSIFNTLNPFHLQTFDAASLARLMSAGSSRSSSAIITTTASRSRKRCPPVASGNRSRGRTSLVARRSTRRHATSRSCRCRSGCADGSPMNGTPWSNAHLPHSRWTSTATVS